MRRVGEDWNGPSLSVQMRAAGVHDADMTKAFRNFVVAREGALERVAERDPVTESCKSRTSERLNVAEFVGLPLKISTWVRNGDSVLYITIPLSALKPYGSVVPASLLEILVDACRAVHARTPLLAAVIGEEALFGAAMLDLWELEKRPKRGDPGTLVPDSQGKLIWSPDTPISVVGT